MIRICKFNSHVNEISDFLKTRNIDFIIEECLGRCDLCHSGAFVEKDGEFISASTPDLLIENLKVIL